MLSARADAAGCCGVADGSVIWLTPRSDRRIRIAVPLRRRMAKAGASVAAGLALIAMAPGTAMAPLAPAHASVSAADDDEAAVPVSAAATSAFSEPMLLALAKASSVVMLRPLLREDDPAETEELDEAIQTDEAAEDEGEVLSFGKMDVPRKLVETVLRAAVNTETDPVYLMALADKESSFLPAVKASTSSAEGLFQFIENTWLYTVKQFGPKHGLKDEAAAISTHEEKPSVTDGETRERILGLRRDPYLASVMAAEMLKRDRAQTAFRIGRDLTKAEFYLMHFLGPEDAARFMELRNTKPQERASRAFPAAARANKGIFYKRKGRRLHGLTVAEVYERLDEMIDRRLGRYTSVTTYAPLDSAM